MIIAHLKPESQKFKALFIDLFGTVVATECVSDHAEARRRLYFHNRKYVVYTLTRYLNQRMHAIGDANGNIRLLLSIIKNHEFSSFYSLCKAISKNISILDSTKPTEKSKYYNHYTQHVQPILDYCTGNDTGE